jgi:anti-sigma regulatory factor (Ser/Thr protein kinase)
MAEDPAEIINQIVNDKGFIRTRDLATRCRISRQAAHAHLRRLVGHGLLVAEGKGRAVRYRPVRVTASGFASGLSLASAVGAAVTQYRYPTRGLAEDQVWEKMKRDLPASRLSRAAIEILNYAVTETVNNAIDHSESDEIVVELSVIQGGETVQVFVDDPGVGIFERIRRALGLQDTLQALQELSKGKLTTAPENHPGKGVFFVSKAVDYLEIASSGLRWSVDNQRGDLAVGEAPPRPGTRVTFEVRAQPARALAAVFEEYTEDLEFSKTRTVVKPFEIGTRFVSRSEAKRLTARLEQFREVVLDFRGVESVGQGFVDEVFRVFAAAHPEVRLVPVNMSPPVEFMITRGLPQRSQ